MLLLFGSNFFFFQEPKAQPLEAYKKALFPLHVTTSLDVRLWIDLKAALLANLFSKSAGLKLQTDKI